MRIWMKCAIDARSRENPLSVGHSLLLGWGRCRGRIFSLPSGSAKTTQSSANSPQAQFSGTYRIDEHLSQGTWNGQPTSPPERDTRDLGSGGVRREEFVEVFNALDADLDRLCELSFDLFTTPERLRALERLERSARPLRAPQHTLINQLATQASEKNSAPNCARRWPTGLCLLVMIGVRADRTKELVALTDGFRESSQSWADLLRSCRRRGMAAPVLAVGDGALGFWKAVREVFPDTREQRCWFHVRSNVSAALPKSAHPGAKAALEVAALWTPHVREQVGREPSRPATDLDHMASFGESTIGGQPRQPWRLEDPLGVWKPPDAVIDAGRLTRGQALCSRTVPAPVRPLTQRGRLELAEPMPARAARDGGDSAAAPTGAGHRGPSTV